MNYVAQEYGKTKRVTTNFRNIRVTSPILRAVIRAELNLVGLAMRAERKVIDKIVDGLKFHS